MTPENNNNVKRHWNTLIQGWPVYATIAAALIAYHTLWIDDKIAKGIDMYVPSSKAITDLEKAVALNTLAIDTNTAAVVQDNEDIAQVRQDTTNILLMLSGRDPVLPGDAN